MQKFAFLLKEIGKINCLVEPENQAKKIMCETGMEKIDYKKTEN
jgi:hypothetical protein